MGIEPTPYPWEGYVLPLYYTCMYSRFYNRSSTPLCSRKINFEVIRPRRPKPDRESEHIYRPFFFGPKAKRKNPRFYL